jgi:glycerol-3-phosphate acyltransferase PlsY
MNIWFVLLCTGSYLVGSLSAGFLLTKWLYGIDIRQHGTGKIGASNVYRVVSKWLAVPVMLFDIGKGALMVWIARQLGIEFLGSAAAAQVAVGIFTIIGHNWPVFLGFKGGRGIFTSLGVITMLSPWMGLIIFVGPYLFAFIHQVAFGVFLALVSLPFLSWFLHQPLGIEDRLPITLGFVILSIMGLLTRLIVPRSEISQTVQIAELIFNRLLFDRDIRNAKIWVKRKSKEPKS